MHTIVKKWGNSAAVRIPASIMESLRLQLDEFEVQIAGKREGAALADQVKSLDWVVRRAVRKGKASPTELSEVRAKAIALIGEP
ncbi:MAG: hypothetical protein ABIO49_14890 [Dokdonella sp.]